MGTILAAHNLTKYYRHQWTFRRIPTLNGLSLAIDEGEIFGIIGPAGSGKTSFLRAVNRMDEMTTGMRVEGELLMDGRPVKRWRNVYALRARMALFGATHPCADHADRNETAAKSVSAELDLVCRRQPHVTRRGGRGTAHRERPRRLLLNERVNPRGQQRPSRNASDHPNDRTRIRHRLEIGAAVTDDKVGRLLKKRLHLRGLSVGQVAAQVGFDVSLYSERHRNLLRGEK